MKDTVAIDPHGGWTSANRGGKSVGGQLTADQISAIRTLAADSRIGAEAGRNPERTKCRDAFSYEVTVGSAHVSYVDCPADADQPTASIALVKQVLQYTTMRQR